MPNIEFMFKINPEVPNGQVAVSQRTASKFLVMANHELTDAQIMMAIGRWCGRHNTDLPYESDSAS